MNPLPFRIQPADWLTGVAIVLLALLLRVVVLADRAAFDPLFAPLPAGSDQLTYVTTAEGWEAGTWPDAPFRYQPGFTYFLVAARALTGPSLVEMRLVLSLVNALACGWMVAVGWLLTRRRWGGWLCGLLLAVYPVAIFYSTELLVEGLALCFVCLFLFLALWQRERLAYWRTAFIGLTLGLCTITRTNLGLLLLAWLLWLLLYARPAFGRHAALALAAFALVIAPVTLWNYASGNGRIQLITEVGAEEIHRANSRDSDGTYMINVPARATVDQGYLQALLDDFRLNPLRFVELQARKFAIYWSDSEPGNNIDYFQNGEAVSPLLRALPLDFRILAALGLLGTAALLAGDRKMGAWFAALHLLIFSGVFIIWVVSRVRLPAIVPLIATSAYLAVWLVERLRAGDMRLLARVLLPAVVALGVVFAFCDWAIDHLPAKRPLAAVPNDLTRADLVFDETLRLVGWRALDPWPAPRQGWAVFNQAYALELFWEVLRPTDDDYSAFLIYLLDGQRIAGRDSPIGEISYPPLPTSRWEPGALYSEIVGFKFLASTPTGRAGEIRLGVYVAQGDPTNANRPIRPAAITSGQAEGSDLVIGRLAVYDPFVPPPAPDDLTPVGAVFGGQIALDAVAFDAGEPLTVTLAWSALVDMARDYSVFVHVVDASGTLAASYDALAGGALPTSTWRPGTPVYERIAIETPLPAGTYQVYTGLYDLATLARLDTDAPDDRLLLGVFTR